MNAEVIPLRGRCHKCRVPRLRTARTIFETLCDDCFEAAIAFMVEEKKLFEALIARGIDRGTANVMMIAKHNHERYLETPTMSYLDSTSAKPGDP